MNQPIALITGASRGLGRNTALTLAARGISLVITYRSQAEEAELVVEAARTLGVRPTHWRWMWPTAPASRPLPSRCSSCCKANGSRPISIFWSTMLA